MRLPLHPPPRISLHEFHMVIIVISTQNLVQKRIWSVKLNFAQMKKDFNNDDNKKNPS